MSSGELEIEKFLEHVDEWKFKVSEELRGMTPAQRKAFWKQVHEEARAKGLNVIDLEEPEKTVKRPAKRVRRSR